MATSRVSRRQSVRYRIRKKVSGNAVRPRLTVFRSNKGISAQLIDDLAGTTLASASTFSLNLKGLNQENSKKVGEALAKTAKEIGIEACVFDRSGYLYHGNVKSLAEGAREGGLKF
jgi:LSU ribosomal protein L18P